MGADNQYTHENRCALQYGVGHGSVTRRKRGEAAGKDRQMTLLVFTYCHLLPPTATTHYICTFIFGRRRVLSRSVFEDE